MNIERLDKAITVMGRVVEGRRSFSMWMWQNRKIPRKDGSDLEVADASQSEADLHACGNSACFAGWVAVSPEFKADGGEADVSTGEPIFKGFFGKAAISEWLECDLEVARLLVFGDVYGPDRPINTDFSRYYGKKWGLVTAADVIEKLEGLKAEAVASEACK